MITVEPYSGRQSRIDVDANVHGCGEMFPIERITPSLIHKNKVPKTYGEAIQNRVNRQGSGWSNNNNFGSYNDPRINN